MNWSEFFHMGGYAFFVWTSYGFALLLLVFNIVSPLLQRRRITARIKRAMRREAMEAGREASRAASREREPRSGGQ